MVGFYFLMKDLLLPTKTIRLFWSFLSLLGSVLPVGAVKLIFSSNFIRLLSPLYSKKMTQRFGFQGKPENKFSSYEEKVIPTFEKGVFERDFTNSKCSFSIGNCLFLLPLPLFEVRGFFFTLFQMSGKQGILPFVYV